MSTDASLIKEYLEGNDASLEVLFKRYAKIIFNFSLTFVKKRDDAEDIVQDSFLKAWKNLKKFDQQRDFKIWLLSITRNTALDYLRKRRPLLFSQFENEQGENILTETIADTEQIASDLLIQKESTEAVQKAVEKLTTEEQLIIYLHDTEGMTFIEISEALDQSQNTLKSRYRRALIKLKSLLSLSEQSAPKTALVT